MRVGSFDFEGNCERNLKQYHSLVYGTVFLFGMKKRLRCCFVLVRDTKVVFKKGEFKKGKKGESC